MKSTLNLLSIAKVSPIKTLNAGLGYRMTNADT